MPRSKHLFSICLFILGSMLLAACKETAKTVQKDLRLALSEEFTGLDPALAVNQASIQLVDEVTVGLTRQNEQTAQNELAMATGYKISEDGRVYTFAIRDDVPWVQWDASRNKVVYARDCANQPRKVSAYDFEYGMRRTMTPATGAEYAFLQGLVIEGAQAFINGETEDFNTVGVKALDAKTLEIRFKEPAAYNLSIAGLWFNHAMPRWLIEGDECTQGRGELWTDDEFFQSYGPFVLKQHIPNKRIIMARNPFWPGTDVVPSPKLNSITWEYMPPSAALAEFEEGNLDVTGFPPDEYERMMTHPEYSRWLYPTRDLGTEFYSFNTQLAPTDDVRVRRALSMAIDRNILVQVSKSGIVAPYFCNPGATGCPQLDDYYNLGIKYDLTSAQHLLQSYLNETGQTAEQLKIVLMYNTSENNKLRAETVINMWKYALGVNADLVSQDWTDYKNTRKEGKENVYRSSWVQDYPDANNFLKEVFATGGAYSDVVDWNSPEFDTLCAQAALETDPAARMALYASAEKILVEEQAVIAPLIWYSDWVIVRPSVKAPVSITGYNRYEKWEIR